MTIHNLSAYVAALWDWGFLDGCFANTGIRVSDIDGFVERNGWCIAIETKGPGKSVPNGQRRMFAALVDKGFTVLVIWGKPNKPERMQVWYPHRKKAEDPTPATLEDIADIVARWFRWADANGNVEGAAV